MRRGQCSTAAPRPVWVPLSWGASTRNDRRFLCASIMPRPARRCLILPGIYHVSPGQMLAANQLDPAVRYWRSPAACWCRGLTAKEVCGMLYTLWLTPDLSGADSIVLYILYRVVKRRSSLRSWNPGVLAGPSPE